MTRWHVASVLSLGLHVGVLLPGIVSDGRAPALTVETGPTSLGIVAYIPRQASPDDRSDGVRPAAEALRPIPSGQWLLGAEGTRPSYRRNTPPPYPLEAYLRRVQGTVWLVAEVDAQGRPRAIRVTQSSGSLLLDDAALQAVRGWEFVPAYRGSRPIASRCRIPVQFRIEEVP